MEPRLDDMTTFQSMTLSRVNLALTSQGPAEGGSDVTAGRLKMPGKGTPSTPCPTPAPQTVFLC